VHPPTSPCFTLSTHTELEAENLTTSYEVIGQERVINEVITVFCLQNYTWQAKAGDTFIGQPNAFRYTVEPIPDCHTLG